MTMSSFVTYLRIDASLENSLCLLCPLHLFILLQLKYEQMMMRSSISCTEIFSEPIKQSENWLMPTVNPNVYPRDGTSLVNSLCLLCPLYSFVPLLSNNLLRFIDNSSPDIERNERLMAQKEIVAMPMSSFVTYLRIYDSLMYSLCLLCPLY